jgi:hypothetical protein
MANRDAIRISCGARVDERRSCAPIAANDGVGPGIVVAIPRTEVNAMFGTMRRHHHPADSWEPDDADEIAEEETIEEIRHCAEWAPPIDLPEALERSTTATRRRWERTRLNRAWRQRTGRAQQEHREDR